MIKIFRLNDYEWYAGETLQECIDWLMKATKYDKDSDLHFGEDDFVDDPSELTEEQMNTLMFYDEDTDTKMTFRQRLDKLIAEGETFPCPFAGSDW